MGDNSWYPKTIIIINAIQAIMRNTRFSPIEPETAIHTNHGNLMPDCHKSFRLIFFKTTPLRITFRRNTTRY